MDLTIEHIQINGIWNKYSIDFPVKNDVNILVGNNGVGKTTILNIVCSIISDTIGFFSNIDNCYDNAIIQMSDSYVVKVETNEKKEKVATWSCNGKIMDYADVLLKVDVVSNIDSTPLDINAQKKLKSEHEDIESELDMNLYDRLDSYYRYTSSIGTLFRRMVQEGNVESAQKLYEPIDLAEKICNDLFYGKTWFYDEENRELKFKLDDSGDILKVSRLSSGEKQMLILILSTLVHDKKGVIIFWDEPEISLHIEWQEKIIKVMRELNPKMQLIIATHSPSILYDGWENRAINVDDIKTKKQ